MLFYSFIVIALLSAAAATRLPKALPDTNAPEVEAKRAPEDPGEGDPSTVGCTVM